MASRYEAVVIGLSAGGMEALKQFVPMLPENFPLPVAIAQHIGPESDGFLAEYLDQISALTVREAEDKEPMCAAHVYLAPAGYHLLIEDDHTFSLSTDPRVNHCCPAIDVLFESAADVFGPALIGVVLTGANNDGSQGLKTIKSKGGIAIVQNPETAVSRFMPQAALETGAADAIIDLPDLVPLLIQLSGEGVEHAADCHS